MPGWESSPARTLQSSVSRDAVSMLARFGRGNVRIRCPASRFAEDHLCVHEQRRCCPCRASHSDGLYGVVRAESATARRVAIHSRCKGAFNDKQYRRAVIDAGTAAELVMTTLIDRKLAGTDSLVKKLLVDKYQTLNGRA